MIESAGRRSYFFLSWRKVGLVILWTVNGIFLAVTLAAFLYADVGVDWDIYTEAGQRYFTGGLYEWDGLPWRYNPLLAPVFGLIAPIGYVGWSLLHFAALLVLPRKMALLVLVSAPFWNDVYNGNTMTFVFVAAWQALAGRPVAFFALSLLIPRPVMLPVLAVLWRRWRLFAVISIAIGLATLATGWVDEWVFASDVANLSDGMISDMSPANIVGPMWYPISFALAAGMTWKGWLGPASFLASAYWSLHYGLMLLLEPRRRNGDRLRGFDGSGVSHGVADPADIGPGHWVGR